jgi:hypothetical protein
MVDELRESEKSRLRELENYRERLYERREAVVEAARALKDGAEQQGFRDVSFKDFIAVCDAVHELEVVEDERWDQGQQRLGDE